MDMQDDMVITKWITRVFLIAGAVALFAIAFKFACLLSVPAHVFRPEDLQEIDKETLTNVEA